MPGRGTFLTGLIGFIIALLVLIVTLLLPVINAPRTRWSEVMPVIIPAAVLTVGFLITTFLGMFAMMNAKNQGGRRRSRRDDWDDEDDDDRPRSRRRRDEDEYDDEEDDRPRSRRR